MALSVNAASAAQIALQTLRTGLSETAGSGSTATSAKVATSPAASDPAVITASTDGSQALASGLSQGASVSDAASAAARAVGALLAQLQTTATAAAQPGSDGQDRTSLTTTFAGLLGHVDRVVQSASVGGQNLVNGSLNASLNVSTGAGVVRLSPQDLTLGGPIVALTPKASIATASSAAATLGLVSQSLTAVGAAIDRIDAQADQLGAQTAAASPSRVSGTASGAPDGDSVRLLALQVQQALAAQPSTIANPSSQAILSLFKS